MPDPRCPYARWLPGANAGYRAGRTPVRAVVCHYTVGVDSTPVGLRGYFHFLVSRGGQITQFAEADAVCWHAGDPWNGLGPGIEVEHLPGRDATVFTDVQRDATAALVHWLHHEWGVPLDYWDGERIRDWHGFIAHGSLIQTGAWHHDAWPREDWDRIVGRPSATPRRTRMEMIVVPADTPARRTALFVQGHAILHEVTDGLNEFGVPVNASNHRLTIDPNMAIQFLCGPFDAPVVARLRAVSERAQAGSGSGPSPAEIRAAVRAELDRTRLAS